MRRSGFLIPCLAILLTACNEGVMTHLPEDASEAGRVTFSLSADMRNDIVGVKSSAEDISVDDFWVEIFNSSKTRVFCEKYVDAKDTTLFINSGDYTLLATYGTETGVGFDKPFYKAEEPFTVGPQETKPLSATARLANVKVAVNFDEDLADRLSYEQYWAVVRNNGRKLRFNPNETRAGYIPAGALEFVLVVKINGEYRQWVSDAVEYAPNDFVTFNVDAPVQDGNIVIKVMLDDTVEVVEVDEVVVPIEDMLPIEEPVIYSEGFGSENTVTYVDGQAQKKNELWISASAEGVLSSAVLSIDCPDLGLPSEVDLVTADDATAAAFEEKGIWWKFNADKTSLSISLLDAYNDHISKLGYVGYDHEEGRPLPVAQIGLKIEAASGAVKTAEENYAVYAEPNAAVGELSWNDYDVWAWKIENPKLVLGEGKYDMTKIQYSMDGQTWIDFRDVTSADYDMGVIEGLAPGTTYHLRAMYDGWLEVAPAVSFTTETALQVGNADFEEFTEATYNFTTTLYGSTSNKTRTWYLPYADETDAWWAVNSKKTMPSNTTPSGLDYKVAPTVSYHLDSSTDKSAQLVSTFVCNMASSTNDGDGTGGTIGGILGGTTKVSYRAAGELWIGKADDSGNHDEEGHEFTSRPRALKFDYTYAPNNGESFYVKIQIWDSKKKTIAETVYTDATAQSSWITTGDIEIEYTDKTKDAAYIYIQFRSSSCGDESISYSLNQSVMMAGEEYKGHVGSILKIDNIQLVY